MKRLLTNAIILNRTDFGEADRIITLLTPDYGKLRLMAKGVRKVKSKLAGGIELFSVSHITFMAGKGEIGTLISTRLEKHYGNIIKDIERVQLGYELIKLLNQTTEDHPEAAYFELLEKSFDALDDKTIALELIRTWFHAQLLKLAGHTPNLKTDTNDQPLTAESRYNFDIEAMIFTPNPTGRFTADHIKILRLLFGPHQSKSLNQVTGLSPLLPELTPMVRSMLAAHLHI